MTVTTHEQLQEILSADGVRTAILHRDIENAGLTVTGGKTIDLAGNALTVTAGSESAGISVPSGSLLTIEATRGGALRATGGHSAAGIGGGVDGGGGIVTINGGVVTAQGGSLAPGIGGLSGSSVTISLGATATASAGDGGAAIGTSAGGTNPGSLMFLGTQSPLARAFPSAGTATAATASSSGASDRVWLQPSLKDTDPVNVTIGWSPAAPAGLTAAPGDTEADLSWTAPIDDGGSAIAGYTVEQSTAGTNWTASATTGSGTG